MSTMLFDLINPKKIRRALWYAVYIVAVLLAQTLMFSRIPIFGVKTLFVPAAVVAIAMLEDGVWGAMYGLLAGLLCDMAYGNTALFVFVFPAVGLFVGALARQFLNRQLFAYLCLSFAALVITGFFQIFRLLVFLNQDALALLSTAAAQALVSLPFAVPLYFPCRAIARKR